jgi:hypothetical protein
MSSGLTVVLGWDGLDFDLVTEYGLADAFGPECRKIETIVNESVGSPHTMELWPSIITGLRPEDHGFEWVGQDEDRAQWNSPLLDLASRVAEGVVPKRLRVWLGDRLQERGAELNYVTAADYADRGVDTVFDGRVSLPLTVPNYRTELDERMDLQTNRGWRLGEYVNLSEADGTVHHHPTIPFPEFEMHAAREAFAKLGPVHAAIRRAYDLIFVWIGFLDTVGHVAPLTSEPTGRHGYEMAARATRAVRSAMAEDDTLICVSDHGLQGGEHTDHAFFGTDDERIGGAVDSVLDVRAAIDRVTGASGAEDGHPAVRAPFRHADAETDGEAEEIRSQLEDLGYL